MGTKLGELDEYFNPGLELTVLEREYVVPLPSAELGLWCQRVAAATGAINEASSEAEVQAAVDRVEALPELDGDLTLAQRTLGETYDQMAADGVPHPYLEFCGQTAYIWIIAGEDAAKRYWTSGGHPEASRPTPNRAERRAQIGGSRTDAAESTPKPGSTSGTTSRTTSRKRGRGKGSRGRRSSTGGR